jgi:hypothetical protein
LGRLLSDFSDSHLGTEFAASRREKSTHLGVSLTLDDLQPRGVLEGTDLVMVGEFGRTRKIGQSSTNDASQSTGRDHCVAVF